MHAKMIVNKIYNTIIPTTVRQGIKIITSKR